MAFARIRPITSAPLLAFALLATTIATPAQTLAHRGWEGNGLTNAPWWRNAIFYQLDPVKFQPGTPTTSPLAGIATHLVYLQALNVDAIILSPLPLAPAQKGTQPALDPAYGTFDDFDMLVQQASGSKIRIVVDLPIGASSSSSDVTSLARFWLSRGVAGLRLTRNTNQPAPTPDQVNQTLSALRQAVAGFVGQRVLIVDPTLATADNPAPTTPPAAKSRPGNAAPVSQLTLDPHIGFLSHLSGPELHDALIQATSRQAAVLATDAPNLPPSLARYGDGTHDTAIARLLATILFTNHSAVILRSGQELGLKDSSSTLPWGTQEFDKRGKPIPPTGTNALAEEADPASILSWYRELAALHKTNPAITDGTTTLLDTGNPDVVAWLRKPAVGKVAVVLVNLSATAVQVSILSGVRTATGQQRGFLHSLLPSTDPSTYTPPASVDDVPLPAYGVYIGELKR